MCTMKKCGAVFVFSLFLAAAKSQDNTIIQDSSRYPNTLPSITIQQKRNSNEVFTLPEIFNHTIYAGKKASLIAVDKINGNIAANAMRQVMAKIPGIHIWESDASGIQIGVATRGLSPNRSWEFNVRLNGNDVAADPYGYPEAYFNPPLQAVQKIEVVRGHGALQYGPQFGGMINYILKNGKQFNSPFHIETSQSIGGFGFLNSFLSVGGKTKKWDYYSFYNKTSGNGWRKNSHHQIETAHSSVGIQVNPHLYVRTEFLYSKMNLQQPGGLTDSMFITNPKESLRSRNWMNIQWMTPALSAEYRFNDRLNWNTKIFGVLGERNSVGFLQPASIADTISFASKAYSNRSLQTDQYRNIGIESKFLYQPMVLKKSFALSYGFRYFRGNTLRKANGTGTNGTSYEMTVVKPFAQELQFQSQNVSLFAEALININRQLKIIPGLRKEFITGSASGKNGFKQNGDPLMIETSRSRSFILFGIGTEYHFKHPTELYANITEAYRPIQFAQLQAPPTTDRIDSSLRDSKGFNTDFGWRGKINNWVQFDMSLFYLKYNDRIGTIQVPSQSQRLITNIGNSSSKGLEAFWEINVINLLKKKTSFNTTVFVSYSYTNARYGDDYKDNKIKGNTVENAPKHILRSGLQFGKNKWSSTTQINRVSKTFSDALNTVFPSTNGQVGIIPSYLLVDQSFVYRGARAEIKCGINNLFNRMYFTRRAGGYPGPGILPGEGRNYYCTLNIQIKN